MKTIALKIAEDFTKFPAGRFKTDGNFSGERFREDFLVPKLQICDRLELYIDGVKGYGSSFLEEAFGGLIRKGYFTIAQLKKRLLIKYTDIAFKSYETEIWEYINDAG